MLLEFGGLGETRSGLAPKVFASPRH